jgi:hypothetical protein
MVQPAVRPVEAAEPSIVRLPATTNLVEWYFEQGWTDGLPVVPPTRTQVDAFVEALGGNPHFVECKVPPRHGSLTREVLAINMVMAGCKPEYAPVVRAAMLALTAKAFKPERGTGDDTHGGAATGRQWADRAHDRYEWRLQCVRLRQPRQCDDRARAAPGPAQCRRRLARRTRQEHPWSSREIHLLRRRERDREPMGALSRGKGFEPR